MTEGGAPTATWKLLAVLWAGRRTIGLVVLGALLVAAGYEVSRGVGRFYQATTRLGVATGGRDPSLDVLVATLASGDMARAVQLDPRAVVRASGGPVVVLSVTAPEAAEAIRGANAIVDRALAEDAALRVRAQEEALARGASAVRELRQRAAALRAWSEAAQAGRHEIAPRIPELLAVAETLEERARAMVLPPMGAVSMGPPLRRIDRAVEATRLPLRAWATLGSAGVSGLTLGIGWVVCGQWAREQRAAAARHA